MEKNETKKWTLYDGFVLLFIVAVAAAVFTPGFSQADEETITPVEQLETADVADLHGF